MKYLKYKNRIIAFFSDSDKQTAPMERMMAAMIANQEQLIAANKALEKQVKDLNEILASYKQADMSKK